MCEREKSGNATRKAHSIFFSLPAWSLRKLLFLRLRAVELPARFPSAQWAAAAAAAAAARRSPPARVAE